MDSVLEKFGIYDIMGIWGAGALTVTYFLFSFWNHIVSLLSHFGFTNPIQSELYLLVILYSAVSYWVGIILQELGKTIFDNFQLFSTKNANTLLRCVPENPCGFGWKIRQETSSTLKESIPQEIRGKINFDKAHYYIKFTDRIDAKKVDKCHSAYALARSLFLCFCGHAIFHIIVSLTSDTSCRQMIPLLIVDLFFAWFFYRRSYRYFISWVKNVFIQYAMQKK